MGKGDKKTKRGKRIAKSYGVNRPRTAKSQRGPAPVAKKKTKTATKKTTKKEEVKEEVVASTPSPAKKAPAKKSTKGDNLTKIEGIGPKVMEVLAEAGIDSYEKLSKSKPDAIAEILVTANSRYKMFDPTTWPQQAELAAADKWDELKELQESLDGGKAK